MISLMWAMDENRVIGKDNKLPWHLPEDLKFFKRTTMGHPIAMGRKTWDSIGRPLPGRENIVITRNESFSCEGCTVLNSIDELQKYSGEKEDEIFVIGGAEIFKAILPAADRLYLTMIYDQFEGDTYFPEVDMSEWDLLSREKGTRDEKNPYDFEFLIYKRK
ncbi:dihydrofolate reductase [Sporosarcina globispora]|uniref:Dihydrofolate reductase n=1 Tax=Sporosarcina globispora TaxID=1459 RepID=A0A0M0GDK8_SPOGL|nr:dihydrofolate reductase [Sporosarcina globispora]KON87516.1 dihydrofolate reductase [Sporosarcina globispora]